MSRKIKNVWMLTILSSFLLIVLQGYWLYSSTSYSIGEMEKKNMGRAENAVIAYLQYLGNSVRNQSHIGYVVAGYFSDYKKPVTTICSPEGADTVVNGIVERKPAFRKIIEHRDTFDLRETDIQNSADCLNTYITFQMTPFDNRHFSHFMSRELGDDFVEAQMIKSQKRLWKTKIVESASLFHHEMEVEVPFNPIQYQSMIVKMRVAVQPILRGMMWQIIGSIIVTLLLLLSFAYLIKVMLLQKKVDKMRGDFVHTMIHELKRPVQTLKMCVSVFSSHDSDGNEEDSQNAMLLETVREESDNLTAYLNKLREVIRAEEHIPLRVTTFNLHASLVHLAKIYRKNKEKEVNIQLDYQRSDDRMKGDRDQLMNVVSNLMENSVKYSGDIVNIHVICQNTPQGEVSITVADNGIGISPEEQSRVWTKFYRSNAYPNMMQPGIGLGLSFVDMIVKAHGGSKKLTSEVGKGTKITIVIPQ